MSISIKERKINTSEKKIVSVREDEVYDEIWDLKNKCFQLFKDYQNKVCNQFDLVNAFKMGKLAT
jgi:hypothetical protein